VLKDKKAAAEIMVRVPEGKQAADALGCSGQTRERESTLISAGFIRRGRRSAGRFQRLPYSRLRVCRICAVSAG